MIIWQETDTDVIPVLGKRLINGMCRDDQSTKSDDLYGYVVVCQNLSEVQQFHKALIDSKLLDSFGREDVLAQYDTLIKEAKRDLEKLRDIDPKREPLMYTCGKVGQSAKRGRFSKISGSASTFT